jgi:hypothetical protein
LNARNQAKQLMKRKDAAEIHPSQAGLMLYIQELLAQVLPGLGAFFIKYSQPVSLPGR